MPIDPSLEELSGNQQWSPQDAASMTHPPEQPNPAAPYISGAKDIAGKAQSFAHGGLTEAFPQIQPYMPSWFSSLGHLAQSPAARDVMSTANIGGMPLIEAFGARGFGSSGGLTMRQTAPPPHQYIDYDHWQILNESGTMVGKMKTTYNPATNDLRVGMISTQRPGQLNEWSGKNTLELKEISKLIPDISKKYPDIFTLSGYRVTGVRSGKPEEVKVMLRPPKTPQEELIRDQIVAQRKERKAAPAAPVAPAAAPLPEPPPPPPPHPAPYPATQSSATGRAIPRTPEQQVAWDRYMNGITQGISNEELWRLHDEYMQSLRVPAGPPEPTPISPQERARLDQAIAAFRQRTR